METQTSTNTNINPQAQQSLQQVGQIVNPVLQEAQTALLRLRGSNCPQSEIAKLEVAFDLFQGLLGGLTAYGGGTLNTGASGIGGTPTTTATIGSSTGSRNP